MLPTQGLFKDIECPYNDNTCGRPYCHFRHKKKIRSQDEDVNVTNEIPTYNPTPKSQLANVRNHIPISYVPDVITRTERSNRLISYTKATYNPTPISLLSNKYNKVVDKSGESQGKEEEYEPEDVCKSINDNYETENDCDLLSNEECDLIDDILKDPGVQVGEKDDKTNTDKKDSYKKLCNKKDCEKKDNETKDKDKKSSSHKSNRRKSNDEKKSNSSSKHKSKHNTKDREKERKSSSSSSRKSHKSDKYRRDKSKRSKDSKMHENHERTKKSETKRLQTKKPEVEAKKLEIETELDDSDMEMFEDDVEQECFKIFQEYQPEVNKAAPNVIVENKNEESDEVEPYIPTSKKRIAYEKAQNITPKVIHEKPKTVPNPAQVLTNRLKIARLAQSNNEQKNLMAEMKQSHVQPIKRKQETPLSLKAKIINKASTSLNPQIRPEPVSLIDSILTMKTPTMYKPGISNESKKRKINPVMNMANMLKEKAKMDEIAKQKLAAAQALKTPSQSNKGAKRTAHVPDLSLAELPDVLHFDKSKLPVNVRTRYLTMLADETVKLYVCREDAYNRALNEEFKVYERCSALMTYRNSVMLAVNRVRKELQERESAGLGAYESAETVNALKESPFKGKTFYNNVKKYVLSEEDLLENGYPREGSIPGKAMIKSNKYVPKIHLDDNQRECARCMKLYTVDRKGIPIYEEECIYHPLKKRTFRGESWYLCCKSNADLGCTSSHTHVCEETIDKMLDGYQTTMEPVREDDPRSWAVYALDCEMCYTTKGLELTRVTIVDSDCKTVYESLVKPLNPIVDYNTRFSGIVKEQMERTSTSILQVQANILHLCNSKTILIGHSLESDMKALKIVHSNIIDTAIMFPHKFGLPHKRALRSLASEYLMKIIQNDISGHDSAEDALTCMELIIYKVKEELKLRNK